MFGKWTDAANKAEMKAGEPAFFQSNGKRISLCLVDGECFAVEDTCTHAQVSLAAGNIAGEEIICPLHAARFNVKTGKVVAGPAMKDLKTYAVREQDGTIQVKL